MKNSITRIIVLESDKSLHTVYKNHFDEIADYELVGSYTSAKEALKDFSFTKPHIVLSEIELNGRRTTRYGSTHWYRRVLC
ncbi:MAG: hypothetical protein V7734_08320, partial [Maribacter arcticus]